MNDANDFAEALCYCGKLIPEVFLKKNYETKWSELKMIELGLVPAALQRQASKKYKCCKCEEHLILDDIREMHCNHIYCVNCLKQLMEDSISGNKEKLKCVKCSKELDDGLLKYLDMDLHERYTSALYESS